MSPLAQGYHSISGNLIPQLLTLGLLLGERVGALPRRGLSAPDGFTRLLGNWTSLLSSKLVA
jgi:hypothetical protein